MQIGPLTLSLGSSPPTTVIVPASEPALDVFALVAAVTEWRDARQAYKTEVERGPATTNDDRRARLDLSGRWSKAEYELAKVARKLGGAAP